MQNFGNIPWANASDFAEGTSVNSYLIETEGIYTGYRYYETRYADIVLGNGGAKASAGTYANADGTIAIVDAATDYSTRNTVFAKDQRLTQGTALRFTATSNYVEVLDAGYVPRLYSSKSQTDNKKKDVYIPPAQSGASDSAVYPELQGYLHMRFYETVDGAIKHERASDGSASGNMLDCAYAYTTAYPNGDYMGLVISNLTFYARGWEHQTVTTSENKKVDKICLTSLTMQLTISDPKTGNDIYTQTAIIPLPGSPEFN